MTGSHASSTAQSPAGSRHARARAALAYERWFAGASPRAIFFRWLMSRPAQFLTNGPALRLPRELRLTRDARVLDIACGRGALLRAFDDQLHFDTPPVGVDFSRAALALAASDERQGRGRESREGARVRLVRGTATSLPFRDHTFSVVTCGYVAKHLDDAELRALLAELHRVLADGGLAVLWEFGPSGNRRLDAWNARMLSLTTESPRLRSSATLRRLATDAGFEFARYANLRPFLLPPIARASVLLGRPPAGWRDDRPAVAP